MWRAMRISEALARTRPFFSFEFFPPRNDEAYAQLLQTVDLLRPLRPAFVSVTYGAGGSTRERTIEISKEIQQRTGITVMAHIAALGHSRAELRDIFCDLEAAGIENVLALRGDPPDSSAPPDSSFQHANEVIGMLKRGYRFSIGAACYPETHQQSPSAQADMEATVRKVEAGAQFLITQLFFENDKYFDFVQRARDAGIRVPILPGLMPITNYQQIARISKLSGATIPPKLLAELEARRDEPKAVEDLGVAFATLQAADLLRRGAPGVHFYTLNKSPATRAIVSALLAATAWRPF
jgi:methylenetetrahydrofolate reductase (NADPH)